MGLFDDVERELRRADSAPPVDRSDPGPRLVELAQERLAVLHEFGRWWLALLPATSEVGASYNEQLDRIRAALVTLREAEQAEATGAEDEMGPDFWKRKQAATKLLYLNPGYALSDFSDQQFAALLTEQRHRPWPLGVRHPLADTDSSAVVWLYRGRVIASSWPGDWHDKAADRGEELLVCRGAVAQVVTQSEQPDAEVLMTQWRACSSTFQRSRTSPQESAPNLPPATFGRRTTTGVPSS
jgi:hypothetical protein